MAGYHLRRKDREISDEGAISGILASCRLATIGMCRGSEPYIVTMNYGYDAGRRALYFHCAGEGLKLDFLGENPSVCATVVDDKGYEHGKCEHKYRSLVVRGRMSEVKSLEEKKHGIDVLIDHQEKDPDPVKERNLTDDSAYEKFSILRLDIDGITGKQSL